MSIRTLKKLLGDIEKYNDCRCKLYVPKKYVNRVGYYCTKVCALYLPEYNDNVFSFYCFISQLRYVDAFERHCIIAGILKSIKYIKF